ncbi:transposase [Corynebacterium uberis]|uniref:transposase n=1 Tax=Corynebacterium uberis TaxID=2883169 RepID=UPI003D160E50
MINNLRTGVPDGMDELRQPGRSLHRRREEILALFGTGASSGPDEGINIRGDHLQGSALGFRNIGHYILLSLFHFGGLHADTN